MDKLSVGVRRGEPPSGRAIRVAGTRPSVRNFQQLTSTGVPSLDDIIGGGIAVGTLVMIEEDAFANYSHVLCRYFLAEGVTWGHSLFVACQDRTPNSLLQNVPLSVSDADNDASDSTESASLSAPDALKIAWKYRNLHSYTAPTTSSFHPHGRPHYFDLSRTVESDQLATTVRYTFGPDDLLTDGRGCSSYDRLLHSVVLAAEDPAYDASAPAGSSQPRLLRVLLRSLGSSLWQSDGEVDHLCRFLFGLRAVLRHTMAVALVTIPRRVMRNPSTVVRLRSLCDTVLSLESFEGTAKTNPIFKDYQGLMHVVRLSSLNTLTAHRPLSRDFGFKLRRKKFSIETLHLPPELSETAVRGREEFEVRGVGCGAGRSGNSKLDF